MAEAVFYLLPSTREEDRYIFACKLAEKAFRSGKFCYLQTENEQQTQTLDNLLWTFRPGSFLPHQVFDETVPATKTQVLIGTQPTPSDWQTLIINISKHYPENMGNDCRILEILDDNDEVKTQGRERFKRYRQAGITITTHKMQAST